MTDFSGWRDRRRRRVATPGFSLLEVLVAMTVLSLLCAVFYRVLASTRSTVTLSANSFAAIQMGSKIMTDLLEEARINTTFLELLREFPDFTTQDLVVDGQSVFFRYIKDRQPTWGVIDLPTEGGVRPEDGELYETLKPFQVKVEARRQAAPETAGYDRHLARSTVTFNWKEKDGQPRRYSIDVDLASPVGPVPHNGLTIDEDALPDRIRQFLFPALTGQSFDQAVGQAGCDRELAFEIGKIGVLTSDLKEAMGSLTQEIGNLSNQRKPLLSKPDADLVKLQMGIARRTDTQASLLYQVLKEAAPSVKLLVDRATPGRLDAIPAGPFAQALNSFQSLSREILARVRDAEKAYSWLLEAGFVLAISQRQRDFARVKSLEALRLLAMFDPAALKRWRQRIDQDQREATGRNPFLEIFYLREKTLTQNPAGIGTQLPNLGAIETGLKNEIWALADRVPELIARHP